MLNLSSEVIPTFMSELPKTRVFQIILIDGISRLFRKVFYWTDLRIWVILLKYISHKKGQKYKGSFHFSPWLVFDIEFYQVKNIGPK